MRRNGFLFRLLQKFFRFLHFPLFCTGKRLEGKRPAFSRMGNYFHCRAFHIKLLQFILFHICSSLSFLKKVHPAGKALCCVCIISVLFGSVKSLITSKPGQLLYTGPVSIYTIFCKREIIQIFRKYTTCDLSKQRSFLSTLCLFIIDTVCFKKYWAPGGLPRQLPRTSRRHSGTPSDKLDQTDHICNFRVRNFHRKRRFHLFQCKFQIIIQDLIIADHLLCLRVG